MHRNHWTNKIIKVKIILRLICTAKNKQTRFILKIQKQNRMISFVAQIVFNSCFNKPFF